jgi:hypothetical protein
MSMVARDAIPGGFRSAMPVQALVEDSLVRLQRWVEDHQYRAYDPGDGQRSYLRALTFGSLTLERILTAVVLRSPLNIRPLLGITPHSSTKGMGYMAWGYLRRFKATGDPRDAAQARLCLDWLLSHRAPQYAELCWGNDFTFTTRAGRIPRGEPTIVWSGLIGQAFFEAHQVLGQARYLEAAESTCKWILSLPRLRTASGDCLSYVAFDLVPIHNSNMLGAALLGRVGALTGCGEALDVARQAMRYSCSRQNEDGAWYYGEAPKYHWIDSFHTGYNLDSLKRYIDSTGDLDCAVPLRKGYEYFKRSFFEPDGRVRYMHDRLLPVDIQCLAQAIDTLSLFAAFDLEAVGLAERVAGWAIANMQDVGGHFMYRDLGWTKIRTPMFHWGQGTMFKALAHLAARRRGDAGQAIVAAPGVR